ncbi:MAG: hypothetical protein M5U17_16600 [Ignavibacterium sp.]|nr:hypothetical protein [Ignavibacterium sp.]
MIASLIQALVLGLIAVCFVLILVGLSMPRKTKRPTHKRRVMVVSSDDDDWWDTPVDDSGWTNGDYICAAELFDD